MTWSHSIDTWIVITGALCALSCALLGSFMLLRRMSMMGDAISHAVLPGLAAAFLITSSRASFVMFVGAAIVGVLTAVFTQFVHRFGRVDRGAAMGVVFTTLFAIGLILIVRAADSVDLDPGCVLYGAIELTPLETVSIGSMVLPRAAVVLGAVLLANTAFVILLYKELKISSFDPQLATTQGINATLMHYLLMTFVAITVVASFEAIGSILVIAMLIVPAAAAHLLTDRLGRTILLAMVFAAVSAALGHVAAITVPQWFGFEDTSTSGMMATVAGALFTSVMLFAPRHGLLSKVVHRLMLGLRIAREDAIGLLYRLEEHGVRDSTKQFHDRLRDALALRGLGSRFVLSSLLRRGLVIRDNGSPSLTDAGREAVRDLVRSHRLWERYLVDELGLRPDHVHDAAMRLEHVTDPAMQQTLARDVVTDQVDPHGKAIPD